MFITETLVALDYQKQGLKGQSPEPPLLHIRACLRGEPLELKLIYVLIFYLTFFLNKKILNTYTFLNIQRNPREKSNFLSSCTYLQKRFKIKIKLWIQ